MSTDHRRGRNRFARSNIVKTSNGDDSDSSPFFFNVFTTDFATLKKLKLYCHNEVLRYVDGYQSRDQ